MRPISNGVAGTVPQVEHRQCAASQIGKNSVVAVNSAGLVTMAAANSSLVLGVALNRVAAGTAGLASRVALVCVDRTQRYIVQSSNGTIQALTDYRDRFFALVSNATVNATTGESKGEMTGSSGTSVWAVGTQLRCVDLYSGVDNAIVAGSAALSSNADFIVELSSQSLLRTGVKGV